MKYLSVCSGIEAATVAWHELGWEPWAFSEIEPFPAAVLAHHYPNVPNLGDMTKFKEWPDAALDLLVGGTPCQSFSVAGLRKGLDDPRGNLMLTYLAIADRYRPRWLVWENVPGVLSSGGGRDFGTFLGGLGQLGYGFAYRVLDAQYFGVAQRRRRVFVVGYLGDWRRAAAVLFERHSLQGHPAPSRKTGEEFTRAVAPCIDASFGRLQGCSGQDSRHGHGHLIAFGGNNTSGPIDVATARNACSSASGRMDFESETFITTAIRTANTQANGHGIAENVTHTLDGANGQCVAFPANLSATQHASTENLSPSLGAKNPTAVAASIQVRRLTPRECERLQGFPDGYTNITVRGKPAADGPRYKALGNSMAVPVMAWIGRRIQMVEDVLAEAREKDAA